ncbi:MAG: lipoate-protein ligase B, partial [Polaromonas sp.]
MLEKSNGASTEGLALNARARLRQFNYITNCDANRTASTLRNTKIT